MLIGTGRNFEFNFDKQFLESRFPVRNEKKN